MDESNAPTAIQFVCSVCSNTRFPATLQFILFFFCFFLHVRCRLVELICAQEFVVDVEDSSLLM